MCSPEYSIRRSSGFVVFAPQSGQDQDLVTTLRLGLDALSGTGLAIIIYLGLPLLGIQMLKIHNHKMRVVIDGWR